MSKSKYELERIDQILKDLYASVKYDGVSLNSKAIYHYLIQMDVSNEDRAKEIDGGLDEFFSNGDPDYFHMWIKRFSGRDNIMVYCSPTWRYFCQFINGKVEPECVKMYIPLDYDHIYECANRIFDFLEENNISHRSKIGREVRFDDIVVRLNNVEDAKKLQNFVNNDSYIKEGFVKNNPFAFCDNGCSYAFDGHISYNDFLSKVIYSYIKVMVKDSNVNIDDVNASSFSSFVSSISNNLDIISNILGGGDYDEVVDAYFVTNLIKLVLNSDDMKDFFNYVEICKNEDIRKDVFGAVVSDERYLDFNDLISNNINNDNDKESLLQEFILTTMKKYPLGYDEDEPTISGIDFINGFLSGKIRGVTRDNNLRERVRNNLTPSDVYDIVAASGIVGDDIYKQLYNYIRMVMLNDMINMMRIRFPNNYINSMNRFIETDNELFITERVGNVRALARTLNASCIVEFFYELGVKDINEYILKYYGNVDSNGFTK